MTSHRPAGYRSGAHVLLLSLGVLVCACRDRGISEEASVGEPPPEQTVFRDVAADVGLDFVHVNGRSGRLYFPEMMGAGAALFDADNDGDLDLYLVQGETLLGNPPPVSAESPPPSGAVSDRLYRNDIPQGDGEGLAFRDVTASSGIPLGGYGMGVATGDVDNDGWVDLYVLDFGPNRLLRNLGATAGGIAFEDVTASAGADDRRWSTVATFFDFDADGWLDLFVGNYLDYTLATDKPCFDAAGARDYCGPQAYPGEPNRLLRNLGGENGGRVVFEDVTIRAGLGSERTRTLGAMAADFDADGRLDLYVANDGEANQLWQNRGDGTFSDEALFSGCALNEDGRPEASMGVAVGDVDGDGDEDVFITHINEETSTLYLNESRPGAGLRFRDFSQLSGLGPPSLHFTGFGTALLDVDNDGSLDLIGVNGAVRMLPELVERDDPFPLHQRKQLWRNTGAGVFEKWEGGPAFELSEVGRGLALGDVDNDGDVDVVVTNNGGPVRLLRNEVGAHRDWIGLRLVGPSGRDMLGAWVATSRRDMATRWRRVSTDGSYASARDPRIVVGLGGGAGDVSVEVQWPDGLRETWNELAPRSYVTLRYGTGLSGAGR